jgi:hypothetical protein
MSAHAHDMAVMAFFQLLNQYCSVSTKVRVFSTLKDAETCMSDQQLAQEAHAAANLDRNSIGTRFLIPASIVKSSRFRFAVIEGDAWPQFAASYAAHAHAIPNLEMYQMIRSDASERKLRLYIDAEILVSSRECTDSDAKEHEWAKSILKATQQALRENPDVRACAKAASESADHEITEGTALDRLTSCIADRASRLILTKGPQQETKVKWSYHLFFPRIYFPTTASMKAFVATVPGLPDDGADLAVYSNSNQALGLTHSGKVTDNQANVKRVPWDIDTGARVLASDFSFALTIVEVANKIASTLLVKGECVLLQPVLDAKEGSDKPHLSCAHSSSSRFKSGTPPNAQQPASPVLVPRSRSFVMAQENMKTYLDDNRSWHRASTYVTWSTMVFVVSTVYGKEESGLKLLLKWSRRSEKHKQDNTMESKLQQLYKSGNGSIGVNTMLSWAAADGVPMRISHSDDGDEDEGTLAEQSERLSMAEQRTVKDSWIEILKQQAPGDAFNEAQRSVRTKACFCQYDFVDKVVKVTHERLRQREWDHQAPSRGDESESVDEEDNISAQAWKKDKADAESLIQEYLGLFHFKITGDTGKPELLTCYFEQESKSHRISLRVIRRTFEQAIQATKAHGFSLEPSKKSKIVNPITWLINRL